MTATRIVQAGNVVAGFRSPRCAARYAHFWGCSLDVAAREFGVDVEAAQVAWHKIYPGEPPDPAQRGAAGAARPLAPQPLATASAVDDLVDRARDVGASAVASADAIARGKRSDEYSAAAAAAGWPIQRPTCVARVGARYAMLAGCSLHEAARAMRLACPAATTLSSESIRYHWHRLYPGVNPDRAKRAAATVTADGAGNDGGSQC